MTTKADAIRARIAALRAKTTARGCTEAEAMAAAEKAAALMAEYGIAEGDLDYDVAACAIGARRSPIDDLWNAVAVYCDCTCWLDRPDGRGTRRMVYFGAAGAVEIAGYVHDIMERAYRTGLAAYRASPDYQRRRLPHTRAAAARAWTVAYVAAMTKRLVEGLWKRNGSPKDFGALLLQREHDLTAAAIRVRGVDLRSLPALPDACGRRLDAARRAAEDHAASTQIEAGVRAAEIRGALS